MGVLSELQSQRPMPRENGMQTNRKGAESKQEGLNSQEEGQGCCWNWEILWGILFEMLAEHPSSDVIILI